MPLKQLPSWSIKAFKQHSLSPVAPVKKGEAHTHTQSNFTDSPTNTSPSIHTMGVLHLVLGLREKA